MSWSSILAIILSGLASGFLWANVVSAADQIRGADPDSRKLSAMRQSLMVYAVSSVAFMFLAIIMLWRA